MDLDREYELPRRAGGRCGGCGMEATSLRRGRCASCYARWVRSRPVGLGALCGSCGDRRLEHLRHFELHTTWLVLCHNCAARADRLNPLPRTPLALIERIARDRRQREEMRVATHSPLAPAPSARPGRSSVAGDGLERRVAVRSQRSLGGAAHLAVDDLPEEATSEFGMITAVHLKV